MLQKTSILEEGGWYGAHLNKIKNMKTLSYEELETVLIQWLQQMRLEKKAKKE
jgi:hypothetical protein